MTRTRQKINIQNFEKNSFMQTVKRFTQINVSLIEIDEIFIKKTKSMKIEKIFEKKISFKRVEKIFDDDNANMNENSEFDIDVNMNEKNLFAKKHFFAKKQFFINEMLNVRKKLQRRLNEMKIRKTRVLLKRRFRKTETNETIDFSKIVSVVISAINKIKRQKKNF